MTVVIGTAGHIDHGKTALLRALTGIDADRLPEEQRRGMTIDVGYAHLDLEDGTSIDFVDVPGHDALIGNMLVGAGEIDAALLVVAADDGPRAQTVEHLGLLDALGIPDGLAVVTKLDVAGRERALEVAGEVVELLAGTSLAGSPVLVVSSLTGEGLNALRAAVVRLRDLVSARAAATAHGPVRLAIDRAFMVRGRGAVVTGSLRGGSVRTGDALRLEPRGIDVRVRGLEVHHGSVDVAERGRTALNLGGVDLDDLERGAVLTAGPGIEVTDRLLVELIRPLRASAPGARSSWPPADGSRTRLHVGTAQVDASVGRRGREAADLAGPSITVLLRLGAPVAIAVGDRGVLRRPSPGDILAGVRVLDPDPPRGISRRRADPERLAELARAVADADVDAASDALVALHGGLPVRRLAALAGALGRSPQAGPADLDRDTRAPGFVLAPDVREALELAVMAAVVGPAGAQPLDLGVPLTAVRRGARTALRRLVTVRREDVASADAAIEGVLADLVVRRRVARDGERLRDPARAAGPSAALALSMERLEAFLDVAAPPDLSDAARTAGCPPEGVRALEAAGRIVRVEADLAWAAPAFEALVSRALSLARRGPLTPAALRDATGTSRRYVMPLLEELDRQGLLERTPAGHVLGPRAPREAEARR